MIEYLRMLKDGVRHMSYGDPYEGPTVQASDVVQWAVDEIASLLAAGDRLESQLCEAARERDSLRLTDAEREAVEWYANFPDGIHAATLRGLLERTK